MLDELSALKLVTTRLATAGIAYMVTGSILRNVIAAQPSLDWLYLDTWAGRLGVRDLLSEVRR